MQFDDIKKQLPFTVSDADSEYLVEDGTYYDDETDEELACSRYCIGVDSDGDGISVWLNDDMQEVDA